MFFACLLCGTIVALSGCKHQTALESSPASDLSTKTKRIDPNTFQPGPIRHETLSAAQTVRIRRLQQIFCDVDPSSLDKWEEDFRRDSDPDREIRTYEGMAEAYQTYCAGRHLSSTAKQDVYGVVILRSAAPDDVVLSHLQLRVLSVQDAKQILKGYRAAPAPIEVTLGNSGG